MRFAKLLLTITMYGWTLGVSASADEPTATASSITTSNNMPDSTLVSIDNDAPTSLQGLALTRAESHTSSVQDLSIFGVISLGILGMLWVRRHTTEL